MPAVPMRYGSGALLAPTFAAVEPILGGQIIEGRPTVTTTFNGITTTIANGVGVAAAGSVKWMGVAVTDAAPPGYVATQGTSPVSGQPLINAAPFPAHVAAQRGVTVPMVYAAAANEGDQLVCAAGGQVTPAAANADGRAIVGRCDNPGGVAAGAIGRTYINA